MPRPLIPALLWASGAAVYLTAEAVSAGSYPGYRYGHDYISDLGRPDAPRAEFMNAGFVLQGVAFAVAAHLLCRSMPQAKLRRTFLALAVCYAVGMVVVGFVPSGRQSVQHGLGALHPVGAALALAGGNAALVVGGTATLRAALPTWPCRAIAALGGSGLVALMLLVVSQMRTTVVVPEAIWERTSAYTIVAGEVFIAVTMLTGHLRRRRDPDIGR